MAQGSKANSTASGDDEKQPSDIAVIREQTRECLELLRSLVGLLVNKPEREGPTLEDLLAALVAQQRDALILLQQIASDRGAILDRLPALPVGGGGTATGGHAGQDGAHRL